MNPVNETPSYEQALADLDQIVRTLEDGQTGLEESLAQFEKGISLIKFCYQQLSQAEQRIHTLCGQDEQGRAVLQPFAHASAMESQKTEPARRPSKPNNPS